MKWYRFCFDCVREPEPYEEPAPGVRIPYSEMRMPYGHHCRVCGVELGMIPESGLVIVNEKEKFYEYRCGCGWSRERISPVGRSSVVCPHCLVFLEEVSGCLVIDDEYSVDDCIDGLLRAGFKWGEHIPRDCVILESEWDGLPR